jgi:hypothetical protein
MVFIFCKRAMFALGEMVCKQEMFALGEKPGGLPGLEGKPGGGLGGDTLDFLESISALLMAQALTHKVPGERELPLLWQV